MKKILNFLIRVNKLKEIPRTGWVLRGVKNPETIAEHTFRLAVMVWLFGEEKKLEVQKMIKEALFHDICEVYAGDIPPFFYYLQVLKSKQKKEEIFAKWVRLSQKEKIKRSKMKLKKEKQALLKVIKGLKNEWKKEILSCFVDYVEGLSKEGRFFRQVDKIETFLQAIEYFGPHAKLLNAWWEEIEEIVEDPLLLEFIKVVEKKFYGKSKNAQRNRKVENFLDFFLKIGKIKRIPRLYWILRKIKNPETVAGHIFTVAIMAWVFGKEKPHLSMEKLLKMALCHEITAIETGDTTPYDRILKTKDKEKEKILAKMIRLSEKEKKKNFWADYKKEKKTLEKITKNLDNETKKEIINLWEDYRKKESSEGIFLSQLNTVAVLFQGVLYKKKIKNFSTSPLWEWAFESVSDPLILKFLDALKEYEKN